MSREKAKGRLFVFVLFALFFLLGGPALAAEEEALSPPNAVLHAKSLCYTGEVQYVSLDHLSHPKESEGHYSFSWYKNGELLPCASASLPIRFVSDTGSYYCKVLFTYNGETAETVTDAVQITVAKKEVSVPDIPPLVYTGYRQHPTLYSTDLYELAENAGGIEAGEYFAVLRLKDSENTAFASGEGEMIEGGRSLRVFYTVARAENTFTTPLSLAAPYEGELPSPHAYARFGEVRYRYFSDAAGMQPISVPTAVGVYYVQAFVEEGESVLALSSPLLRFEILPLSAVALRMLSPPSKTSYTAFEPFSLEGVSLVATMANGSVRPVKAEELSVRYGAGANFLLAADRQILLCYGGAVLPVAVTVERAKLSFSSAVWSESAWVYDGEEREITVTGLPPEVSVVSYRENRVRTAGTHTVSAVLSYDRENYEGPEELTCLVTVEKQPVPLPVLSSAVYNGSLQSPVPPTSALYYAESLPAVLHAGVYSVVFLLSDPLNYCFEGSGGESAAVSFELLPMPVSAVIEDTVLYLGDRFSLPPYRITSGSVVSGEDLGLCYREVGGGIEYYFENPDYLVTFEGGTVERVYRLPASAESAILLGFLSIVFIALSVLGMILLYKKSAAAARSIARESPCTYPVFTSDREQAPATSSYHLEESRIPELAEQAPSPLPAEEGEEPSIDAVDVTTADALITDALAQALVMAEEREIFTEGSRRGVINVDTLSAAFAAGEEVDINRLKKKKLLAPDVGYLKVLARGSINKPLTVYADDFSLGAIKMIALTGGRTFHVKTKPLPEDRSHQ